MLTTLILEGNSNIRRELQKTIQNRILINPTDREYDMEVSLIADNIQELIEYINKHCDKSFLLFVDENKLMDNFSLMKEFKDRLNFIEVVFLIDDTSILQKIIANKAEPLDIINKDNPLEIVIQNIREDIDIAFSRYKFNFSYDHPSKFTYEISHGVFERISLSQVHSIETISNDNKRVTLVCESFKKVILGSLKNIEATHNTFFRCNRTTLVNISNIRVVDKLNKKLILNNGSVHKISTRKVKKAVEIFYK